MSNDVPAMRKKICVSVAVNGDGCTIASLRTNIDAEWVPQFIINYWCTYCIHGHMYFGFSPIFLDQLLVMNLLLIAIALIHSNIYPKQIRRKVPSLSSCSAQSICDRSCWNGFIVANVFALSSVFLVLGNVATAVAADAVGATAAAVAAVTVAVAFSVHFSSNFHMYVWVWTYYIDCSFSFFISIFFCLFFSSVFLIHCFVVAVSFLYCV